MEARSRSLAIIKLVPSRTSLVGYKSRIRRKTSLITMASLLNEIVSGSLPNTLLLKQRLIGLERTLQTLKLDLSKIRPNYNLTS
jgi:hypothetical protein